MVVRGGLGADLVAAGSAALLVAAAAAVGARLLDEGVPLHVDAPPLVRSGCRTLAPARFLQCSSRCWSSCVDPSWRPGCPGERYWRYRR